MVTPRPLQCLYYPYSRTLSVATLKKAILLFDEIVFLDSQPWFIRRELIEHERHGEASATEDDYNYLLGKGIVRVENPEEVIQEFDPFLTANVVNDIHDPVFCEIGVRDDVTVWEVLKERIPPSFLSAFYPGAGTFSEAISLQALKKAEGSFEKLEESIRRFAEFRWKGLTPDQLWEAFLSGYRFVIGGNPHIELESYEIPFLQASSLRINEALLVSATNGYVPFTDSVVHDRMMNTKVNRSLRAITEDPTLRDKLEVEIPSALPYEHLTLAALERLVPEEELRKRTLQELVKYREENKDQLARMRLALGSLAAEFEATASGSEYYRAIRSAVESKVIPEITKAREELVRSYEAAFGKLAIQSAQVTIPTLAATLFGGLGLWVVLGACALAEVAMLTTQGAGNLLAIWRAKRVSGRGAYSYLTQLGA